MKSAERPQEPYFREPEDRKSPRRVKVSTALRFYDEVLGLDHLHYGLWNGEPINLEGLRVAQQRYEDRLLELIPDGVASVLDVGSGTGVTSARLRSAGYEVEGLSPDPHQESMFRERVPGAPFHLGRFQEFVPSRSYDLVLMSESAQYVWIDDLFETVRRVVDDGYWLLADYFVAPGAEAGRHRGHDLEAFRTKAAAMGYELEHDEDITERVLPTLELGRELLHAYVRPSLNLGRDVLSLRHPWLFRLGRALAARRIAREVSRLEREVDPDEFAQSRRYVIQRYRVQARDTSAAARG